MNAPALFSQAHQAFSHQLLHGLSADQTAAVLHQGSPLLILAGAGTGKTRVLTTRIAWAILNGDTEPEGVLALTFTNRAAREMRERIHQMTGRAEDMHVLTFHAFAARMLRQHGHTLDWPPEWTVLDAQDSRRLLRQSITRLTGRRPEATELDRLIHLAETTARALDPVAALLALDPETQAILNEYQQDKRRMSVRDFSDIISDFELLLNEDPGTLTELRTRFTHIYIDEYQDTDPQQDRILMRIADGRDTLTAVGDDDQLLYSWRGADIETILTFPRRTGATILRLETNHRSTAPIVAAAARVLAPNRQRLGKTLTSHQQGPPIRIFRAANEQDEARRITEEATRLIHSGINPQRIAILVRAAHIANPFEIHLNEAGIPYVLSGGHRFQDRAEIRDITARIRLALNPRDKAAFERAITTPRTGIGAALLAQIETTAQALRTDLTTAAERMALGGFFPGETNTLVRAFSNTQRRVAEALLTEPDCAAALAIAIDDSGYRAMLQSDLQAAHAEQDTDRITILETRLHNLGDLERLGAGRTADALLDQLGFSEDSRPGARRGLFLGTIHAAKGLEFDIVFLPAWEDRILPSHLAIDAASVEEERRIAHVALTRARHQVIISHATRRFGAPTAESPFLADIRQPYAP